MDIIKEMQEMNYWRDQIRISNNLFNEKRQSLLQREREIREEIARLDSEFEDIESSLEIN